MAAFCDRKGANANALRLDRAVRSERRYLPAMAVLCVEHPAMIGAFDPARFQASGREGRSAVRADIPYCEIAAIVATTQTDRLARNDNAVQAGARQVGVDGRKIPDVMNKAGHEQLYSASNPGPSNR